MLPQIYSLIGMHISLHFIINTAVTVTVMHCSSDKHASLLVVVISVAEESKKIENQERQRAGLGVCSHRMLRIVSYLKST